MKIHIVKKGDTLYSLSKKYGVSLDQLIAMNPQLKDPNQLSVGMKVKVPSSSYSTGGYEIIHKHVVKEGDTLWKLSKAWGLPLNVMIAANPQLKNPNVLLVGQVVNIPKPGSEAMMEEAADQQPNAKAKLTAPKPLAEKAEMLQPKPLAEKVELLQPKEEAALPEAMPETTKPQPLAETKPEVISKEEVPAKEVQPLAQAEEVKPIPFHEEKSSAPQTYAMPHLKMPNMPSSSITPSYSANTITPLSQPSKSTKLSAPSAQSGSGVDSNSSGYAVNQVNAMFPNANVVPCHGYPVESGCYSSPSYMPTSVQGWGGVSGAASMKGVYLGNCPPGTIPMGTGNWGAMQSNQLNQHHTSAHTMYAQYDPYKAPIIPAPPVIEPSMQSFGYQQAGAVIPLYDASNTSAHGVLGTNEKSNIMDYSPMTSPIVTHEADGKGYKGMKQREEGDVSIDLANEVIESGSSEESTSSVKREQAKRAQKSVKKKAKVRNQGQARTNRGSIPWING